MRVLKVEPYKAPYEIEIPGGLESLQHEVGGYIEILYPSDDLIGIVCNEEGKLDGLELNRSIYNDEGERVDIIAGTFLVAGLGEEDLHSLPDHLMQKYKERFEFAEHFMLDAATDEIVSVKLYPERVESGLADTHEETDYEYDER